MSATAEDALAALRSIDASLKLIVAHFGIGARATESSTSGPSVASDADLDGAYGNPEVKAKDPRDWTGPPMRGHLFSECPPAYLDLVADRLDYFIEQAMEQSQAEEATAVEVAEMRKKIKYNKRDAARARGWAARLRAGWVAPEPATGFPSDNVPPPSDDDIPF